MVAQKNFFAHPLALVESTEIGERTRIWAFAHVMPGVQIGSDCNIGDHAFLESGVVLGNNVTVKNGVAVWVGVQIADNVFLGPNCVFTNDSTPRAHIKKPTDHLEKTWVRENATVGANATVLCGITIGRYAFVGAGAVVTRPVSDFALVVGNPARQVGWMCACARKLPAPVALLLGSVSTCRHCYKTYIRIEAGLGETGDGSGRN